MFYSAAHDCYVYDVEFPAQICAGIAAARALDATRVAIPNDLFALQLARRMGLPVPEIMDLAGYDWPIEGGRSPWRHQKHMANFMVLHPKCFNLSSMGTAKTLAALWAADYLMGRGAIRKALVLAPLSTLSRVWEDEIFRNLLGRRRAVILYGARQERSRLLTKPADFYILNHDGLAIGTTRTQRGLAIGALAAAIRDRPDIDLIIVDEASAYKDPFTRRYRILRNVVEKKPYLWFLSGTPTPNAPTDAYGMARLTGQLPTESFNAFRARTMFQVSDYKWKPKTNATDIVNKVLQPAIRYSREECIDLPPCVYVTRDVELSPTQAQAYATLKRELAMVMRNGQKITVQNEAVLRTKLIQISTGCVYGPNREIHRTDSAPRFAVLREVLDEAAGKALVFAPLTSVVDMLFLELTNIYGTGTIARVYGGTTQAARSEIFRTFQHDPNPRVIVADPGTMAHGLTLTAADTIVWYGPTERAEIFEQACARINRPGQTRHMLIVKLASTPVEREIYRRLQEKSSMQGAILQLVQEGR